MGSLVSVPQRERVQAHVEDAVEKGATVADRRRAAPRPGPGVLRADRARGRHPGHARWPRRDLRSGDRDLLRTPRSTTRCEMANDTEYGLNASVWGGDRKAAEAVGRRIEAGNINVNDGLAASYASKGSTSGGVQSVRRRQPATVTPGLLKYTERAERRGAEEAGADEPAGHGLEQAGRQDDQGSSVHAQTRHPLTGGRIRGWNPLRVPVTCTSLAPVCHDRGRGDGPPRYAGREGERGRGMEQLTADDPQWIGQYRLLRRLGSGGMGLVYLGRTGGGRTVAVKRVHADYAADAEFRARFRQEVAAARRVGGRWTAPVFDADTEGPQPWVATGYVAGPSLQAAVRKFGPLPPASVRALGAGLAEALSAVHGLGLVHRDVKPSNVLLALDGPRLIDFGITRALDAAVQLTRTGLLVGSPGYLSPEQAQGRAAGPASDVFSLGAVLAFAAAGTPPFGENQQVATLLYRVLQEDPRSRPA